jgi:putative nucleotidyltransferase with HDIG domain
MFTKHDSSRQIRAKVLKELEHDSVVPSFSIAAPKLMSLINADAGMEEIGEVVKLEAGLTSKVLRLANSVAFGGKSIKSIDEALMRIGIVELRRLAMAIGIADRVSHLKVKVDWNMYWLHCLLTARVTEVLAAAYRELSGKEYLAGLLHDVGKLFLEHHFPKDFEAAIFRAMERGSGMYEAEKQLYDTNHAEVGSLLCEKWGLHKEIVRGIRFHHEPASPFNKDQNNPEEERLLATCICVADALANMCKANIQGAQKFDGIELEGLPGWNLLQEMPARGTIDLNLELEIQKAQDSISALMGEAEPAKQPS